MLIKEIISYTIKNRLGLHIGVHLTLKIVMGK